MTNPAPFRRKLGRVDLERMNIPEDLWLAKVQNVSEDVREKVETYLRNIHVAVSGGAGLVIYGSKGVGKTAIATLIAKEARSRGHTALFCRIWELREMIRSRVQFDSDSSMSERARDVDVLVLDDLRAEDAGEKFFTLSEINELVRYRASRRCVTVITTRLDKGALTVPPMNVLLDVLLLFKVSGPDLHDEKKRALKEAVLGT
jgi:DNA replication protein DnaC